MAIRGCTELLIIHLSLLCTGSGGNSVEVSNLAWLDAPMVQHFELAYDDLIPIPYKPSLIILVNIFLSNFARSLQDISYVRMR